jgi:hypothetical protein
MGLSRQQAPLSPQAIGRIIVPGQQVSPHGRDRDVTVAEAWPRE